MFAHGAHLVDLIAGTSNATVSFLAAAFAVAAVLVVCALLCRQEWQALLLITVAMMYQRPGQLYLLHGADSTGVFSCTGKGDDTSKCIAFCGFDGI